MIMKGVWKNAMTSWLKSLIRKKMQKFKDFQAVNDKYFQPEVLLRMVA